MNPSPLKRIAVFYDGSFFTNVSRYYRYKHARQANISFTGLHNFIRHKVAALEANDQVEMCQIVESHFFRGRSSLKSVNALADPTKQLETDRFYDQLLMRAGIITHFFPMNESVNPPEEKGIDVWLALEAFDLAMHKQYDVIVLFAGDQDFVPLVRKINSIGTRVMLMSVNITTDLMGNKLPRSIYCSGKLLDEASYVVRLDDEIDAMTTHHQPSIDELFI